MGRCTVTTKIQASGQWYMSVKAFGAAPSMREVRQARTKYLPAVLTMAIVIPDEEKYAQIDKNIHHLFELKVQE